MHINQISHHFINIPTIKSIIKLQVVSGEGEQGSADERPNCRDTNASAAAWSRCWSQGLICSYDGGDGCGSEEDGAGDLLHLHCVFLFVLAFDWVRGIEEKDEITEKRLCCLRKMRVEWVWFIGGSRRGWWIWRAIFRRNLLIWREIEEPLTFVVGNFRPFFLRWILLLFHSFFLSLQTLF